MTLPAGRTFLIQTGHIDIVAFVREAASCNLNMIIIVDENGDTLDVSLVGLVPV
jgi:hypothetical protein